nr:hypothetical protein [uncultured Draconibacterium sp.]
MNTKIQNVNAEKNTANEKWVTPEIDVISVDETEMHQDYGNDGMSFS